VLDPMWQSRRGWRHSTARGASRVAYSNRARRLYRLEEADARVQAVAQEWLPRSRTSWARLLRMVFEADPLACPSMRRENEDRIRDNISNRGRQHPQASPNDREGRHLLRSGVGRTQASTGRLLPRPAGSEASEVQPRSEDARHIPPRSSQPGRNGHGLSRRISRALEGAGGDADSPADRFAVRWPASPSAFRDPKTGWKSAKERGIGEIRGRSEGSREARAHTMP